MIPNRRSLNFCALFALSSIVFFVLAGSLSAGTLNSSQLPSVKMTVAGESTEWDYSPPASSYAAATDSDGGYELSYDFIANGVCNNKANIKIDELQFNPDPFVLNNVLITNTTATTQIYSVTVGLPTSFGAPNFISGNVRTSVIDGGTDGATVATVGALLPIYQAQIDGSTVATLQNNPFSVSAPAGGSNTASASFGPTLNAIPVGSSIGIVLNFSLTAGDTASILSRFDVNPVPEPTSLVWSGLVVAFVYCRVRRLSALN
jgi:hypothetical protein